VAIPAGKGDRRRDRGIASRFAGRPNSTWSSTIYHVIGSSCSMSLIFRITTALVTITICETLYGDDAARLAAQKHLDSIQWYFAAESGTVGNQAPGIQSNAARFTDESLRHLRAFNGIRHLQLDGTSVTDAGLAELASMATIETLNLWGTKGIRDEGLVHLAGLTRLEKLTLNWTSIKGPIGRSKIFAPTSSDAAKRRAAIRRKFSLNSWGQVATSTTFGKE
jgi:hypothetical protein